MSDKPTDQPKHWLARRLMWADSPKTPDRIFYILCVLCVALVAVDVIHHRHAYSELEETWAFYCMYGFLAFAFVVQAGRVLRLILKRDEDYYDR